MDTSHNYDTDDDDYSLPDFFSPMFDQVREILDPGDNSKEELEWAQKDSIIIKTTGVNYTQEPQEKTGVGKPISE